jgi:xylose isomerase
MRTYLILKAKAAAFRTDPRVLAALDAAGVGDLSTPTLAPGESVADLLADRASYEDYDADSADACAVNIETLDQLALDHLFGVA